MPPFVTLRPPLFVCVCVRVREYKVVCVRRAAGVARWSGGALFCFFCFFIMRSRRFQEACRLAAV